MLCSIEKNKRIEKKKELSILGSLVYGHKRMFLQSIPIVFLFPLIGVFSDESVFSFNLCFRERFAMYVFFFFISCLSPLWRASHCSHSTLCKPYFAYNFNETALYHGALSFFPIGGAFFSYQMPYIVCLILTLKKL